MDTEPLLLDRYQPLETLGEGGFSKVIKAFDTKMERLVAIKTIPAGRQTAIRALREAKTVALLNHPGIVTLYEFEQQDEFYYLIMEYVEGLGLESLLRKFGQLPIEAALAIATQICEALEFAHKNDVIHRDIKPANIRILADGRVKVMDFGIARLRSAAKTSGATAEGEVVGTFAYMSPEQSSGEVVDERSDIFSMGVLLYELTTGRLPFVADTPAGTIYKILNDRPDAPHELDETIESPVSQMIMKALSKEPSERYALAGELKAKIERLRQAEKGPAAVVERLLSQVPISIDGEESSSFARIRSALALWLRRHDETAVTSAYAGSAALVAMWSGVYLPFFMTGMKFFFPVIIFFLALFLPPAGLAALLALIAAGLWEFSPSFGALALIVFAVYWLVLGRGFPHLAIVPLMAPVLAWLKAPFLLPLAVGLAFGPILAAFSAGFAGLTLACAEVVGKLNYSWAISPDPKAAAAFQFSGEITDPLALFDLFRGDPWLFGQIGLWAGVALVMGAVRRARPTTSPWVLLSIGTCGLGAGYLWLPARLSANPDFVGGFVRPMIISLTIMTIVLLLLQPALFDNRRR